MPQRAKRSGNARAIHSITSALIQRRFTAARKLREKSDLDLTPQLARILSERVRACRADTQHTTAMRIALAASKGHADRFEKRLHELTDVQTYEHTAALMPDFRRMLLAAATTERTECRANRVSVTLGFMSSTAERQSRKIAAARRAAATDPIAEKMIAAAEGAGAKPPPEHELRDVMRCVVIHEAPDPADKARTSEDARARKELRESLAERMNIAGPETRHEIDVIYATLYEESPWLQRLIEWLWRRHIDCLDDPLRAMQLPPALVIGPPGCGKTHLAQRLADLAGVPATRIDFSAATSPWSIAGAEFGWRNAQPGAAVSMIARHKVANPLILLDEVEKAGQSHIGDPLNALLPLLQTETARRYRCPYLEAEIDLSRVTWMLLGNGRGRLPAPLLDRVVVHRVGYPSGRQVRDLVEKRLGELSAGPAVIELAARELERGRLTLRGLARLEQQFQQIDDRSAQQ